MKVQHSIDVSYRDTNDAKTAEKWLNELPDLFAADFEGALRYDKSVIEDAKLKMVDESIPKIERVYYQSIANSSALGHPSHVQITHCSVAASESEGTVFIIDNQDIVDVVLGFLTKTDSTQVWHNYSYDGRLIRYYEGKDAKNVEDTQILAKTLVNHVETFKAKTSLKDLAGAWYGDWAISADNFDLSAQYDPKVLKYAATDACATYKLWIYLNDFVKEHSQAV